jgi:hypothetical protein
MPLATSSAQLPESAKEDIAYVEASFRPMDDSVRALVERLALPAPTDTRWRAALRGAVDALDALERPFAGHDRERFGGPTSRDRLITETRRRFPEIWA